MQIHVLFKSMLSFFISLKFYSTSHFAKLNPRKDALQIGVFLCRLDYK